MGKKVLISSTNPVHSLTSLFGQDLWKKGIQRIEGTRNLYATEIDITATIERYKAEIRERLVQFLKFADIPVDVDPFVEIATTNPAFEESAMFDDMINLILNEKFDAFVFDTAPVAHTYRLLGMSKVYDLWLRKMVKSREEALSLRVKLSFRKEKILQELKKDPLLATLIATRQKTESGRRLLTDKEKTAFFFVLVPEEMILLDTAKAAEMFRRFDVPIAGYELSGSDALGAECARHLAERSAVLMANHGLLCVGKSPEDALHTAEVVEHTAHIVWGGQALGGPVPLPEKVVRDFSGIYGYVRGETWRS